MIELIEGEEWRDIAGYEDRYAVSNMGRVLSFVGAHSRLITGSMRPKGVFVQIGNKKRCVHRLVKIAFDPIDDHERFYVLHNDDDLSNNRLDNLRWVAFEEHTPASKLSPAQRHMIFLRWKTENITQRQLAREYGVHRGTIQTVIHRACAMLGQHGIIGQHFQLESKGIGHDY